MQRPISCDVFLGREQESETTRKRESERAGERERERERERDCGAICTMHPITYDIFSESQDMLRATFSEGLKGLEEERGA